MILELTMVDGKGDIVKVKNPSPEFNAVSAGLGLTGIITEMVLQLTPPTNTKLITRYLSSDATLFEDIEKMLKVGCCLGVVGGGGWGRCERDLCMLLAGGVFVLHKPPDLLSASPWVPQLQTHSTPPTCWCSGALISRCTRHT